MSIEDAVRTQFLLLQRLRFKEAAGMAGELGNIEILVSVDELREKAEALTGSISTMEQVYEQLNTLISGTASYWEGTAGDSFRKMFTDNQTEIGDMIQRLKDHPDHLLKIAGNTEETESSLTEANMALPSSPLE